MIKKYVFITPYFREDRVLIERCIDSVKNQSIMCDHIVIADGFPQNWIDELGVRHLKLDLSHSDYGNTPRGLGALLAVAEQYDGIGFLDADNWLESNHLQLCLEAAAESEWGESGCDFLIAQRYFRRFDETILPIKEEPDHVDTNCFFFLRGSFSYLPHWALQPKCLAALGDRCFYKLISSKNLNFSSTGMPSVNYFSNWASHYLACGENPPPSSKQHFILKKFTDTVATEREAEILNRLLGFDFFQKYDFEKKYKENIRRNDPCPCGSSKKFKHCHGKVV
jgi:glycosyltransferase involved in cell wall biosynthesis